MKNLLVYYDPDFTTTLEDIPIPHYDDDEVLIKVIVAGSNPKDWKHPLPDYFNVKVNQGDDAAGFVEAVGKNVKNFRKGDRVAGFHVMDTPRGAYAEYTVCPANTVFHIPESVSFEEAATLPLAAYTAAVGLFRNLRLPLPFERRDEHGNDAKIPLIINAASSAVGAFAAKLAKANPIISPVIGIAGASAAYAKESGCDLVIDYRSPDVTAQLEKALDGAKCYHVFDASNSAQSVGYLTPVLEKEGRYTCTTSVKASKVYGDGEQERLLISKGVWFEQIWVGSVHDDTPAGGKLFGSIISRIFEVLLAEGKLSGQPFEVVKGGLEGVKGALLQLRDRKSGNSKFVTRIADTPGL